MKRFGSVSSCGCKATPIYMPLGKKNLPVLEVKSLHDSIR